MSIYLLTRIVNFITGEAPAIRLITSFMRISFFIPWALIKCSRWKKHTTKVAFLYVLFWCTWPNLSFRDQVPEFMIEPDRRTDEETILVTLIIFHTMNYNRFLTTVILIPIMIFPSYYAQTYAQLTMWYDPYTNDGKTLEEKDATGEF